MFLSINVPRSHLSILFISGSRFVYFFHHKVTVNVLALAALQGSTEARYETHTFMARRLAILGIVTRTTMTKIFQNGPSLDLRTASETFPARFRVPISVPISSRNAI